MKANNLTICIDAPCNKACKFCISRMTFAPVPDHDRFYRNVRKVYNLALAAGVNSVLITSKGEPLMNPEAVLFMLSKFREFPTELQTNGSLIDEDMLKALSEHNLDTIAVSASEDLEPYVDMFDLIHEWGFNSRLTIVLTDLLVNVELHYLLHFCQLNHIGQLTLRRATTPAQVISTEDSQATWHWIKNNTENEFKSLFEAIHRFQHPENLVRHLPWGASVYDIHGIAVTIIDYCIQESNNHDDIRSLIYHQDGHLYTSWDKPSSIIF